MKNLTYLLTILLLAMPVQSFSQEKQDQAKDPIRPALLVIDIQNAFLPMMSEKDKETAMTNINVYINLFRSNGCPVIRIYHSSEEYGVVDGTEGFEFPASVLIKPEDMKVIKTYPDGFNKTDLDKVLRETGCNTLFLCGLSAVGCVLATYIGANNHDYKAFLVKDALISHNSDYTNNIEDIFEAVGYEMVSLIVQGPGK
ncbi:MAG: isochorismatase family protein [Bacteroidota bacterium]